MLLLYPCLAICKIIIHKKIACSICTHMLLQSSCILTCIVKHISPISAYLLTLVVFGHFLTLKHTRNEHCCNIGAHFLQPYALNNAWAHRSLKSGIISYSVYLWLQLIRSSSPTFPVLPPSHLVFVIASSQRLEEVKEWGYIYDQCLELRIKYRLDTEYRFLTTAAVNIIIEVKVR